MSELQKLSIENKLTDLELSKLTKCEIIINTGIQTFDEVGRALLTIRDSKLYRERYDTFEDYCQQKWQLSSNYSNRLISSFSVIENLMPIGTIPKNESQTRELSKLSPEEQQKVWSKVIEISNLLNKPITASLIRQEVKQLKPEPEIIEVIKEVEIIKDPELIKENKELSSKFLQSQENIKHLKNEALKLEREISQAKTKLKRIDDMDAKEIELSEKEERIKIALIKIHELEKKRTELFSDSENLEKVMAIYVNGRDFFQKEVFYLAGLEVNPSTKLAMQKQITELIEMVDNWKFALKDKFLTNQQSMVVGN